MADPPTSPRRGAKGRAPHRRDENARLAVLHAADDLLDTLIDDAQHDSETARTFRQRYLDPQRASERTMLQRGITSGELPDQLVIDDALDALCGPILYRALTGAHIPRRYIDTLIADTLHGVSPETSGPGSR